MDQPRQIIVRTPNWLGDHVMALAFYQALRTRFPEASITALMPHALKGLVLKTVIDEEWGFHKNDLKNRSKRNKLVTQIQDRQFDLSINLNSSWSSHWLFFRAKIPQRLGFSQGGTGILATQSLPWRGIKSGQHKSQLYLGVLELMGGVVINALNVVKPASEVKEDFIVLAPGAAHPLREWPYFLELLIELHRQLPRTRIKVVGTHLEESWQSRIRRLNLERVDDLIGKTSLSDLLHLCRRSRLVIANDSGVAHLAATCGQATTLVIFGPGSPNYIAPQGTQVSWVTPKSLPCSPCEKAYCRAPFGYQACLKRISTEEVLGAVFRVLSL